MKRLRRANSTSLWSPAELQHHGLTLPFKNPSTLSDIIHYVHMLKEHKSLQLLKLSHITLIECLLIKCIHDWTN